MGVEKNCMVHYFNHNVIPIYCNQNAPRKQKNAEAEWVRPP